MSPELGNFTPVSHLLTKEVGLVCAAVYGVVWRYCQMKEGTCRASLNTLGADLSIDRATVLRSIEKLCNLGYLIDQTPDRRNAPHTYILGKSVAECNSSIDATVVVCNTDNSETVAYNNSSNETVAQNNATVAESYLKIDSKETDIRDTSFPPKKEIAHQKPVKSPAFQVYVERTEYYSVTKEWIKKMTSIVGDKPEDLIKWGNVVSTFTGRGKWKGNVKDMLGWFVDGIPIYNKDQNGSHPPANKSSPPLNKTRLEELQAESVKEIYDPLKGT